MIVCCMKRVDLIKRASVTPQTQATRPQFYLSLQWNRNFSTHVSHMLHVHNNVFAKPVSIARIALDFLSSTFGIFFFCQHFHLDFVKCKLKMCINAGGMKPQMHECLMSSPTTNIVHNCGMLSIISDNTGK